MEVFPETLRSFLSSPSPILPFTSCSSSLRSVGIEPPTLPENDLVAAHSWFLQWYDIEYHTMISGLSLECTRTQHGSNGTVGMNKPCCMLDAMIPGICRIVTQFSSRG
jgi:hypothetical protein